LNPRIIDGRWFAEFAHLQRIAIDRLMAQFSICDNRSPWISGSAAHVAADPDPCKITSSTIGFILIKIPQLPSARRSQTGAGGKRISAESSLSLSIAISRMKSTCSKQRPVKHFAKA